MPRRLMQLFRPVALRLEDLLFKQTDSFIFTV